MQRTCANSWCKASFEVTDDDLTFYDKVSPVFGGKKFSIPPPTRCPICRMQRRQAYRNDRSLYQGASALSGTPIVTMYDPAQEYVVYDQYEWWGDAWDPLKYGRAFDFQRQFFEQFTKLQRIVPRFNVFNRDTENCDFVNYAPHCRNCYLIFGAWFNQDCLYGQTVSECKDSVDNLFLDRSELCYENVDGNGNYRTFFSRRCSDAVECAFCFDCKRVKRCIGCSNLRGKENHISNEPVSKEEFDRAVATLHSHRTVTEWKERLEDIVKSKAIHQACVGLSNESVSGDCLYNCKNANFCFSCYRCQDIAFCARMFEQSDTYDFEGGGKGQLVYEGMSNDFSFRSLSCTTCEHMQNAHYCDLCFECSDCFGCVGLRRKQYCIFNVQFTKQEYEGFVQKIIEHMQRTGEWGEMFPVERSPFAYNETMAQEYFPLTKEDAMRRRWRWKERTEEVLKVERTIPAARLPDSIDEIPDDILNWAVTCEATKRPFRIIKQELEFYRKMRLPVPRLHPDERHRRRMALRNPRKLWERPCMKCGKPMQTTYSPDRPEIVYCEKCYLEAVY